MQNIKSKGIYCKYNTLLGQTLPRKGLPLGSRDNPDVIEIEEVIGH